MTSTRYAIGPISVRRFSRAVAEAGFAAAFAVWTGTNGSTFMALAGAATTGWVVVRTVLHRHELRALLVDERGVRVNGVFLRWSDIREVVLMRHGHQGTTGGEPSEIGLLPHAGTTLPSGLTALVRDADPEAVPAQLRLSTAGWQLDVGRLATAVRVQGSGVPLVEWWGLGRRVLT